MRESMIRFAKITSPATTVAPFVIPSTNNARNSKRYGLASSALRKWLMEMLEPQYLGLSQSLVPLMSYSDTKDVNAQEVLVVSLGTIKIWFLEYLVSGKKVQGIIPNAFWDRSNNCPFLLVDFFKWVESTGRDLRDLRPVIRFMMSWLDLGKVYTIPKNPSLAPIISKFSGIDPILKDYNIKDALESLGILTSDSKVAFKSACENFSFHESSAAGPNGHALWASHMDGAAIDNDPKLLKIITSLADKTGLTQVTEMASNSALIVPDASPMREGKLQSAIHSRLHLIFEKGIKSRIIAIGDYYSQCLLSPFMVTLRSCLECIPQDYTYNQEAGFSKVLDFTRLGKTCYSLDLSKATDRLPLALQERVMGIILGDSELARLWSSLLSSREFVTQTGHKVRYEVGQPQGFKSSFHSLAMTHHVIVRLAALKAGEMNFTDYVILGDDIVLTNEKVVKDYMIIMELLGVKISLEKSLFHKDYSSMAEFCKRIACNGHEITGIPMHLLANTIIDPQYTMELWEYLASRSICKGFDLYEFFGLFLGDLDFERLGLLNVLPVTVTGMKSRVILEESPLYSTKGFEEAFGFSLQDVEHYYYYCLVSDQIAKVDGIIKKASSFLSIALETSKLGYTDGTELVGTGIPLTVAIQDKLSKKDSELQVMHPVQSAARTLGVKVVSILNAFAADVSKLPVLLKSGALNALGVSLDALPQFLQMDKTIYGNRRVLDKAIRMLEESVMDESKISRTFIGKVTGVSQAWSVSVGLGRGLVVSPQNSVIKGVVGTSKSRLMKMKGASSSSVMRGRK
ncbi:RNA-dependent RNA polymerase [Tuber excavatum mitovirus]|uniref:RNA-dependent RNA polymerase n=1 Tax=Tuber excavatum mitovirus TaxID=1092459 RepID=A0ABM5MC73_9VIRU|nr:RNA-dependent RNA polymerase [Tuber excavatum mitovirus]AEP83726.1 RNA-dependent RNA polymerase [Tuber excavatum mitovirus]